LIFNNLHVLIYQLQLALQDGALFSYPFPYVNFQRLTPALVAMAGFGLLSSAANAGGDVALGEYLSGQCTTCHQLSGKDKGIPSIVGWDEASFAAVMGSYKNKERENKVMQNIATSLNDEDVAALAAYFATLKPKE